MFEINHFDVAQVHYPCSYFAKIVLLLTKGIFQHGQNRYLLFSKLLGMYVLDVMQMQMTVLPLYESFDPLKN